MKLTIITIALMILLPEFLSAQSKSFAIVKIPSIGKPSLPDIRLHDMQLPGEPVINRRERLQKVKLNCPVLLASLPSLVLKGSRKDHSIVNLVWITKHAYSFDRFFIERSLGDTLNFETVNDTWAKAINGIRDEYKIPDDNGYEKLSYYRLRVLLESGRFVYSNVAEVKGYRNALFRLYPNPASVELNLSLNSAEQGEADVSIYDMGGKTVKQQTIKLAEGQNLVQLFVSDYRPGTYTLKIVLPDGSILATAFLKL